jgi:hypothetical protein
MARRSKLSRIPEPALEPDGIRLVFSFKHLDLTHPKFQLDDCTAAYLRALLLQIKTYSEYTVEQFQNINHDDSRHWNYWCDTTETDGFSNISEEIQDEYAWQFAVFPKSRVASERKWRAHGMLVDNVFYIVWLDPDHNLAPKNTRNANSIRRKS